MSVNFMDGLLGSGSKPPDPAAATAAPVPFRPYQTSRAADMYPFVHAPQPATSSASPLGYFAASVDLAKSDAMAAAAAGYAAAALGLSPHAAAAAGGAAAGSPTTASLMASQQFLAAAELAYPLPRLGMMRPEDALADVPRYPWMALAGEDLAVTESRLPRTLRGDARGRVPGCHCAAHRGQRKGGSTVTRKEARCLKPWPYRRLDSRLYTEIVFGAKRSTQQ
ncbi:hypothetical protein V5799_016576 [Amblyomma americanum]|uniref:Uncharacterized protein n=1 Tax=Amblyomma americanum TaxID=6943 RepID=A0AAQ4F5E2_AMBAM